MLEFLITDSWINNLVMLALGICNVIAIGVIVDRFLAFTSHWSTDTRSLRAQVLDLVADGQVEEAAALCYTTPGATSSVLLAGLQNYARHRAITDDVKTLTANMEKAMDDFAQHAMSAVEKRLIVLSTIANAAPLLGMTGTVLGMIAAFGELSAGTVDNQSVAQAISFALVTTAVGLIIALIAVIPFNYFSAAADQVDLEIEESTAELIDFVATQVEARS